MSKLTTINGGGLNILCATDDAYIPYCGIMLTSLFESNKAYKINVYVLTDHISIQSKKTLNALADKYAQTIHVVTITAMQIHEKLHNCPIRIGDHVSLATYFRLLAPILLPESLDKILYLDCDMIVNGVLDELYNTPIDNAAVACVVDESLHDDAPYLRLGLSKETHYFNAGMLLINLKYWREHNVMERCLTCITRMADRLLFHDQDTLNIVLQDEKKFLPLKYNFQTGFLYHCTSLADEERAEVLASTSAPVVIHYTGPGKPWSKLSYHPYRDYYMHYRAISLWKTFPLKKISFKERVRHYLLELIWRLGVKSRPQTYIISSQKFLQE